MWKTQSGNSFCRKTHYGKPRSYQCQVCKAMFETENSLNHHTCKYSPPTVEKWEGNKCDLCDLNFSKRELLWSHNLAFHMTEKKFACDQCDFKSKVPKGLTMHKKRKHESN